MVGGQLAHVILESAPLIKYLHEYILPSAAGGSVIKQGHFKYVRVACNVALRAQIIRHRELQFVDDFWATINTVELPWLHLADPVNMELSARSDVWQAVLSKRACWIAQADLWQPIINSFGSDPPLPCSIGKCPVYIDAHLRLEGKDPNPPCPVFCNIYRIDKAPHRQAMLAEAKKRSRFWEEQVVA